MNQLTQAGIDLIKSFEGCKLEAYQDSDGVWTIGFGHTEGVREGQTCTQEQADAWLNSDIAIRGELPIRQMNLFLDDNKYSALVSLIFNCGPAPLHGHLGTYLLTHNYFAASAEFPKWDHIGGVVSQGLLRRRLAEQTMFNDDEATHNID
jgi:lysozyme